jgi:hypothetical protein
MTTKIWWSAHWSDLTGRSYSDEKLATQREKLLGNQDRKCGANSATDNAIFTSVMTKGIEIGVVTGPSWMAFGASGISQVAYDVTIRIENADFGDCSTWQAFLTTGFTQQALGCEC